MDSVFLQSHCRSEVILRDCQKHGLGHHIDMAHYSAALEQNKNKCLRFDADNGILAQSGDLRLARSSSSSRIGECLPPARKAGAHARMLALTRNSFTRIMIDTNLFSPSGGSRPACVARMSALRPSDGNRTPELQAAVE
jgi:hypothetical protein